MPISLGLRPPKPENLNPLHRLRVLSGQLSAASDHGAGVEVVRTEGGAAQSISGVSITYLSHPRPQKIITYPSKRQILMLDMRGDGHFCWKIEQDPGQSYGSFFLPHATSK